MMIEFNAKELGYIIESDTDTFNIVLNEWDIMSLSDDEIDEYIGDCIKDYMFTNFNC